MSIKTPALVQSWDAMRMHDGERVTFEGVYQTVAIMKRKADPEADKRARTVQIVGEKASVMLEIYYSSAGARSDEEIDRFRGKRVRVVGTLVVRTPDQMTKDGIPMQTMISPSITNVQSISFAD